MALTHITLAFNLFTFWNGNAPQPNWLNVDDFYMGTSAPPEF